MAGATGIDSHRSHGNGQAQGNGVEIRVKG